MEQHTASAAQEWALLCCQINPSSWINCQCEQLTSANRQNSPSPGSPTGRRSKSPNPPLAKQHAAAACPSSHFDVIGLFVLCKYIYLYQFMSKSKSQDRGFFSPLCPPDKAHSTLERIAEKKKDS